MSEYGYFNVNALLSYCKLVSGGEHKLLCIWLRLSVEDDHTDLVINFLSKPGLKLYITCFKAVGDEWVRDHETPMLYTYDGYRSSYGSGTYKLISNKKFSKQILSAEAALNHELFYTQEMMHCPLKSLKKLRDSHNTEYLARNPPNNQGKQMVARHQYGARQGHVRHHSSEQQDVKKKSFIKEFTSFPDNQ